MERFRGAVLRGACDLPARCAWRDSAVCARRNDLGACPALTVGEQCNRIQTWPICWPRWTPRALNIWLSARMRLPSMGGRVRPATSIDGVTFEQAWKALGKAEFIAN